MPFVRDRAVDRDALRKVLLTAVAALSLTACGMGSRQVAPAPTTAPDVTETTTVTSVPPTTTTAPSTTSAVPSSTTTTRPPAPPAPPPAPAPSGWPSAANTGYEHTGVALTPAACSGGALVIDTPGTVIDGRSIPCSVRVNANNVTISRSKITANGMWGIYQPDAYRGLKITDTQIIGGDECEYGVGFMAYTATRLDVSGCSDGMKMEEGSTMVDSWVHDLSSGPDDHNDGVQITGGSSITIRHNRIENPHNQTSVILVGGEFGAPSNILIENNYLDGGNYTIYLDPNGSNRVIRNNTFTRTHVYGPARLDGQVTWTGNAYPDGAVIAP